eukprot:TRINITY_DN17424_c0_g1_i2.p1 TRINITY_DN17424_c0_g1~~TRINITY_DN17424_c0_g1_i2.p1  ORF type:complete len:371 (-),score=55.96 TRINITY_DN17424_c0_g1_i2:196-1308(-)
MEAVTSSGAQLQNFPLNVALCIDMDKGLKPVMFAFGVETPPIQLKLLAALSEAIDQAHYGNCSENGRRLFHQALQKAKVISSNSAYNMALKRLGDTDSPMPKHSATLQPKQPQLGNEQRRVTTQRRRISLRGTPTPEVPELMQKEADDAFELIREAVETEPRADLSASEVPMVLPAMGPNFKGPQSASGGQRRCVDDKDDNKDKLNDTSGHRSEADSPECHAEEQPEAMDRASDRHVQDTARDVAQYVPPRRSKKIPPSLRLKLPALFSIDELEDDDDKSDDASGASTDFASSSTIFSGSSDLLVTNASNQSGDQAGGHSSSSTSPSSEVALGAVLCEISPRTTPSPPEAPRTKSSVIRSEMRSRSMSDN